MNPGVRSSRALRQYLFPRDSSNGSGDSSLHGVRVGLYLPSGEFGAVVGNGQLQMAHVIFRVLRQPRTSNGLRGDRPSRSEPQAGALFFGTACGGTVGYTNAFQTKS